MSRPLIARIDLQALHHNVSLVRACAPGAKLLAVIKANAYGHGMLRIAHALDVEGFAILTLDEALCLRKEGFTCPILMLEGVFSADEWPVLDKGKISAVVHTFEQIVWLEQAVLKSPVDIFLKLNTGMNRLGFDAGKIREAHGRLQGCPNVASITMMTHFSQADEEAGIGKQMNCFRQMTKAFHYPESLANSAAILRHPATHRDWVRAGIMLYGASPIDGMSAQSLGLRPVMTLESALIGVQEVKKGQMVGYGNEWIASGKKRIGVVACGYADGYPRHAPSGTPVLVAGCRVPLVGRVSMDMLAVDITEVPHAQPGSRVILWGEGLPVEEVAASSGTICYELLSALMPRVKTI